MEKHRSKVIYLVLGLMIGSIYAVIMGPSTLEVPEAPLSLETFNFIFFAVGGALIIALEKLKMNK